MARVERRVEPVERDVTRGVGGPRAPGDRDAQAAGRTRRPAAGGRARSTRRAGWRRAPSRRRVYRGPTRCRPSRGWGPAGRGVVVSWWALLHFPRRTHTMAVKITTRPNGPYLVEGECEL